MKYFAIMLCAIIPFLAFAEDIPIRKPGLWEIEIINNDEPAMKMKQCVDAESEEKTLEMTKKMTEDRCTKNETRKEGDTYITETDCTMGDKRALTTTVTTGDFNSHYESLVTLHSVADTSAKSDSKIILNAKWTGECEPGQTPGQVIILDND